MAGWREDGKRRKMRNGYGGEKKLGKWKWKGRKREREKRKRKERGQNEMTGKCQRR